jgi:membrane protein required for colicin V production
MSKVDITLAIIILVGAYNGFRDGFLLELISFLSILLGIVAGFKLMGWVMVHLERSYHIDAKALPYIAFTAVLVLVVFAVNLLSRFISKKVDHSFLGKVDQVAGGLMGLFRSGFMMSVFLWLFYSLKFGFPDDWTADSWVLPMVSKLAPNIMHGIGYILPFFRGIF